MRTTTTTLILLTLYALHGVTFAAEEAAPDVAYWHDWHGHGHGFWWIFPLMMIAMVFFFVICRRRGGGWGPGRWRRDYPGSRQSLEDDRSAPESALDILNKRYARGEIDREEYEEKKVTISSSDG